MTSKFLEFLGEPQLFDDGTTVVAQEAMTKEEFVKFLNEECELECTVEGIRGDWVHAHIGQNDYGEAKNMWWLGCKGMKGAKPVWTT